jgi:hypothetical protein
MRTSPKESVRPNGVGPALATAVALLTLRRLAVSTQPSRAAVLDGADPADVAEVLETMVLALLTVFPDDGEELLQRLGVLAAGWRYGCDADG